MARECNISLKEDVTPFGETILLHRDTEDLWTIEDARCREIIRENFGIDTDEENSPLGKWCCTYAPENYNETGCHESYGETIAEAEIACIIEICKHD